jgi:hypothetical protein
LREEFPGKDIPRVPAKNRSAAVAPGIRNTLSSALNGNGGDTSDNASITSSDSISTTNETPPSSPTYTPSSSKVSILHKHTSSASGLQKQAASHDYHVPREKNRLTLRSFLRQIIRDKRLRKSKTLSQFLLTGPLGKLSKEEEADVERRLEMDRLRLSEQKKFVDESRKRARELDQWLKGFKSDLIRDRILFLPQC